MATQFERDPQTGPFVLEVVYRCGTTDRLVIMVAELLRGRTVPPAIVGQLKYADWSNATTEVLQVLIRALIDTGHADTAICILQRRMEDAGGYIDPWRPLALELVEDLALIRCRDMPNHYWHKVAQMLVADHAGEIASAVFHAHAQRDESRAWFLEQERAVVEVLLACVERVPYDAWQALRPYLWPPEEAVLFVIGFPSQFVERLPMDTVLGWIAEPPAEQAVERAALLVRLTNQHALTDQSLAARIIADYGGDEMVGDTFFSHYVAGGGFGSMSTRWRELAQEIDDVAADTKLPRLRTWANKSATTLREMIEWQRQREAEMELQTR